MPDPRPAAPRSKRGRLTRSADFERVFRKGRSFGNRHLVLHLFPRDDADEARDPRVGLSVSRRVGGAVERNLLRRRMRAVGRQLVDAGARGSDVVVRALPGSAQRDWASLSADMHDALDASLMSR
jgi:ribonuclease P protein component